jgi:hypothetical protein
MNIYKFNTPTVESDYANLSNTIKAFGCKTIRFSIFDTVKYSDRSSDWIIKFPDISSTVPVFKGECKFCVSYWRISDVPIYFTLEDPTWRDIVVTLDRVMQQGDGMGVFLEDIRIQKDKFGGEYYNFIIGS